MIDWPNLRFVLDTTVRWHNFRDSLAPDDFTPSAMVLGAGLSRELLEALVVDAFSPGSRHNGSDRHLATFALLNQQRYGIISSRQWTHRALREALVPEAEKRGRLLLLLTDRNSSDGAACAASSGFFSGANLPPCDYWVAFLLPDPGEPALPAEPALLAWIPANFLDRCAAAMEANQDGCFAWADALCPALVERLARR